MTVKLARLALFLGSVSVGRATGAGSTRASLNEAVANDEIRQLIAEVVAEIEQRLEGKYAKMYAGLQRHRLLPDEEVPSDLDFQRPNGVTDEEIDEILDRLDKLEDFQKTLKCVSSKSNQKDLIFSGCDVHILNGGDSTTETNGKGNLILGYNEADECAGDCKRDGSHNLVVGTNNEYRSYGGVVVGDANSILSSFATVVAGQYNIASASFSSVTGGTENEANARFSSVAGGWGNVASNDYASVLAGTDNTASGKGSSVAGGVSNIASGDGTSILGGLENKAKGAGSSIVGGELNSARGLASSILGGEKQVTKKKYDTVPSL